MSTTLDIGEVFIPHQHTTIHLTEGQDPTTDQLIAMFRQTCVETPGLHIKSGDGQFFIPKCTAWKRDGHYETVTVEMKGRFAEQVDMLGSLLLTSMGAQTQTAVQNRPGEFTFILNHKQLPTNLPLDLDAIPESPDQVYFGETSSGAPLVWDTTQNAHGLIVGENGSGKSEAAALALMQFHLKGWELLIITPTTDDVTFAMFKELGHTVIAGAEPEHFEEARAITEQWFADRTDRERERADCGDDWYQGRPRLMAIDECGDYLNIQPAVLKMCAEGEALARRSISKTVDNRARRGRKIRDHVLLFTQEPYVHNFGTPETFRQLSFRLAVTSLDRTFQPVVFQGPSVPANVPRVLSGDSPKGRAISRGGKRMGDGIYDAVDDVPLQIAYCPKEQRAAICGLGGEYNPPPVDVIEADVIDVKEAPQPDREHPPPPPQVVEPHTPLWPYPVIATSALSMFVTVTRIHPAAGWWFAALLTAAAVLYALIYHPRTRPLAIATALTVTVLGTGAIAMSQVTL